MKILILSHNPITTYHSMGKTLASLFSAFDKKELCQLYIYPTIPDIEFCSSYYRITDKDILRSYYTFNVKGRIIQESEIDNCKHDMFEKENDEKVYRNRKNKTALRMILRDTMWKFAHWNNKNLRNWLKEQNPDCIFVAPGTAKFCYDMALKISSQLNIPIITYICDEYYFVKNGGGLLSRVNVTLLRNKIKQLMHRTSHLISICDTINELYSKEFSVSSTTIMTGTNYKISDTITVKENPQSITYLGNIRYNRYLSLAQIGKTLDEINNESNKNYALNIYTPEKNADILATFTGINSINLCGYVSGEEFYKILHSADILLHTESFDEKNIDLVKNSISTKIADSLASGIPLFAYGPKDIASMQHLIKNSCAVCATNKKELKEKLILLFNESEKIKPIVNNAINTAKKFHDSKSASDRLYTILNSF